MGTFIVAAVLVAIIVLIIVKLIRDKKQGKTSCGCGCTNCAMKDKCHK
ncbi:MAG: FeoB-associated Cys-rich membrane protein [Ruminococcus sp.]|nr:FeoB-associated Cys-rich membrane protein [Ruminococcus sp.]